MKTKALIVISLILFMHNPSNARVRLVDAADSAGRFLSACIKYRSVESAVNETGVSIISNEIDQETYDETKRSLEFLTDKDNEYGIIEVIGVQALKPVGYENALIVYFRVLTNNGPFVFETQVFRQVSGSWALRLVNYIDPWEVNGKEQFYNLIDSPFPVIED